MNQIFFSLLALILLYLIANICDSVFKIRSDKFYRPFHFTGGLLSYFFVNSLINKPLLNLFLVIVIGILWEIYEWLLWKYFPKKFKKPPKKDTTSDLFFDLFGGLTAFLIQIVLKLFSS